MWSIHKRTRFPNDVGDNDDMIGDITDDLKIRQIIGDKLVTQKCWHQFSSLTYVTNINIGEESQRKELNNLQMNHYDNKIDGLFLSRM